MLWDYRVIKRMSRGQEVYVIHEVGFNENGEMDSITRDPVYPAAESAEELRTVLQGMLEAIDKPIIQLPKGLEDEYFEPFAQRAYKVNGQSEDEQHFNT